jgi:nitroimidazol reductase NimA-like FMN-containing flavoprotein (pyridoxamine 5'-phosphate oxidase superfamily)
MTHSSHEHDKVYAFLRQHPMGVLSTVSADGSPWGAAIYYVADDDFNFYFVTRVETHKYKNMSKHRLAALTIADNETQITVQVTGKVSAVPVKDYMDVIFDKLAAVRQKDNPNWTPPIDKVHAGNFMPLCLTPTKLQYANYGQLKSDVHANYIEKII